jgi:hypothetical protein
MQKNSSEDQTVVERLAGSFLQTPSFGRRTVGAHWAIALAKSAVKQHRFKAPDRIGNED